MVAPEWDMYFEWGNFYPRPPVKVTLEQSEEETTDSDTSIFLHNQHGIQCCTNPLS